MEALGINLGYLLVQIIAFVVIYTLLSRFLYDPLTRVLQERRARIAKGLEDASAAANARRNAESEAEKVLAQARADAQRLLTEARERGEELARAIDTEARTAAEQTRAEARAAAGEERNRQLGDLRGQVAAISLAVAERLLGESLDQKRQQALINDFFAKVPANARAMGGNVEVVSAMPLTDAEQSKVSKEIGAQNVTFSVDPSILGGLIIRSEDRVVDASVRSGLNEMAGRLQ